MSDEHHDEMGRPEQTLGEQTPVRLALVVSFLGVFGAAVWWAAGVQADLGSIKTALVATTGRFAALDSIESRVKTIEIYGSPKSVELEKSLRDLEKKFDLYKIERQKP